MSKLKHNCIFCDEPTNFQGRVNQISLIDQPMCASCYGKVNHLPTITYPPHPAQIPQPFNPYTPYWPQFPRVTFHGGAIA